MSNPNLEESKDLQIDFKKLEKAAATGNGLIPVVTQDAKTKEVLILSYTNRQAFAETLRTGKATFWSTSRNELWIKGATSGDELEIEEVRINCEQNALLYLVIPKTKNACHTNRKTCFYRKINKDHLDFL